MREEIASVVYPVFNYALTLKERLLLGEKPDFDREQANLKGLLGTDMEARRSVDLGGDASVSVDPMVSMQVGVRPGAASNTPSSRDQFLGARYALACWLDDIFILDPQIERVHPDWCARWKEDSVEGSLFGLRDRAWRFWEQAIRAEGRPTSDALEVYFLCVMLGFRGDYGDNPEKLSNWVSATQSRLAKAQAKEWSGPPGKDLTGDAAPCHGQERFQQMIMVLGISFLVFVFVLAIVFFRYLSTQS